MTNEKEVGNMSDKEKTAVGVGAPTTGDKYGWARVLKNI